MHPFVIVVNYDSSDKTQTTSQLPHRKFRVCVFRTLANRNYIVCVWLLQLLTACSANPTDQPAVRMTCPKSINIATICNRISVTAALDAHHPIDSTSSANIVVGGGWSGGAGCKGGGRRGANTSQNRHEPARRCFADGRQRKRQCANVTSSSLSSSRVFHVKNTKCYARNGAHPLAFRCDVNNLII